MQGRFLRLEGNLAAPGLAGWVSHRAGLLNLAGWFSQASPGRADILVVGPEPLLDAMEISCSLGPADVFVHSVTARPAHAGEAEGLPEFLIR